MRMLCISLTFCAACLLGLPAVSSAQHSHSGGGSSSGHSGSSSSGGYSHNGSYSSNYSHYSGSYSHPSTYSGYSGTHSAYSGWGNYYGAHPGSYYGHNGYYGNGWYGHNGYYGHGYYGYGGFGWPGYGLFGGFPLFSYPWGYSRYDYGYGAPYYQGSYYYGPVDSYVAAPTEVPDMSYMPETAAAPSDQSMDPNVANVEVRLPANATLWVLGQKTDTTGAVRHLYSPELKPGETYTYQFRARWTDANGKTLERTKSVDVKAGAWIGVDFNKV